MRVERRILTAILAACLVAPGAMALDLGSDVTIWDGLGRDVANQDGWWRDDGANGPREDNEVEPGALGTDAWDLERVLFQDIDPGDDFLRIVSTYNFLTDAFNGNPEIDNDGNGNAGARRDGDAGDLFIIPTQLPRGSSLSPEDDPLGNLFLDELNLGGWYLNIDWQNSTGNPGTVGYTVYAFTPGTEIVPTVVPEASPWRAVGGTRLGTGVATLSTIASGDLGPAGNVYRHDASAADGNPNTDSLDGAHNVLSFNWSDILSDIGIDAGEEFNYTVHFTMSCGNDAIYGSGTSTADPPVPEPASMALLGMGILGFAMRRRFTA